MEKKIFIITRPSLVCKKESSQCWNKLLKMTFGKYEKVRAYMVLRILSKF